MASLCVDAQKTLALIFVNDIPTQVDASVLRIGLRPKFSRVLEMPFEMLPEGLAIEVAPPWKEWTVWASIFPLWTPIRSFQHQL
jgi:hypothetical protein